MAKKPYIPQQVQTKVAQRIKELRINAGYSSYEVFAHENDLDRKQYWRAENGVNLTLKSSFVLNSGLRPTKTRSVFWVTSMPFCIQKLVYPAFRYRMWNARPK